MRNKKVFVIFFLLFLNSSLNFEHFQKKDDPHRFCISEIKDTENVLI